MTDIDPTDHALATIASILEAPERTREQAPAVEQEASFDADQHVLNDPPLAPEAPDADGYCKVGPGPMEALRFRWSVRRGEDDLYYVHETIGEFSTPIVNGPMSSEAAIRLVDEREAEAFRQFEALRDEIAGRNSVAELVRRGEA